MVAYSFKRRFVEPIRAGLDPASADGGAVYVGSRLFNPKRQTIRAERARHARPGEELQLYCGMRTKGCFLIAKVRCVKVTSIAFLFNGGMGIMLDGRRLKPHAANALARRDGFDNVAEMHEFWKSEHSPLPVSWGGVLIEWEPLP
jgi:hypothetical protein